MAVAKADHEGRDWADNHDTSAGFSVPVPPEGLSQRLPAEEDEEGHRLHIWYYLVGLCSESHRVFYGISCK